MNLSEIKENIGEGKILRDLYSGTSRCQCGKTIELSELKLGGFGTSLACSCGKRFWVVQDDEDPKELLVYEGYKYITDENFIIIKQKVYSQLNWKKSNLLKDKLRIYEDYLYIDFYSKTFIYLDINGRPLKGQGKEFFKNISVEEMVEISKKIEEYCLKNNITPNYGEIVGSLTSEYNSPNFGDVLKKAISEYYIENFTKEGLSHLFSYDFLLNSSLLEKEIHIDKTSTTPSSILGIPKKALNYIKEKKLKPNDISLLQNFFKNNTYKDFSDLFLNNNLNFSLDDLPKLSYLLGNGYSASKLSRYAIDIMETENLSPSAFIHYLYDGLRMSINQGLKFKLYSKNLKERHDEIAAKYKIINDDILNKKLLEIHNGINIKQYGDEYVAIVPNSVHAFEEEAANQRHCVLSYAELMASGESLIVFIRHKYDIDKSYITLEIRNTHIVQARKFANAGLNEEDKKYLAGLAWVNGWYM